jgi:hypothetical protein
MFNDVRQFSLIWLNEKIRPGIGTDLTKELFLIPLRPCLQKGKRIENGHWLKTSLVHNKCSKYLFCSRIIFTCGYSRIYYK